MKKLVPLLLLLPVAASLWLQAQTSPLLTAALSAESTLGSCSESRTWGLTGAEWKFWVVTVAVVLLLGILWATLGTQVKDWIGRPFGRHVLLVAGLFVVAVFGSHVVAMEGRRESCEWSKTLDPNLENSTAAQEQLTISAKLTDGTQQRLREQYGEIRGRARHHLKVMAYFFTNYYRAIQMMALLGAIAAVALFFVAFKGWTATNEYVRNVFITATVLTAYFSLYPTVFKQQDNITDNKNLYLQYVAVQDKVRTFAATGEGYVDTEGTTKANEADFLHDIDQRMATLANIAIGFDYTKVGYNNIFSTSQPKPQQPKPTADAGDKGKAANK